MAYNYSRYINREILKNASGAYSKQLSERKLKFIEHYNTAEFKYPSDEFLGSLYVESEVWQVGSRFYKLAHKHYGDGGLWWIIPWFNKVPMESSFSAGDIVMIPKPLNYVLSFFE
tara:strand:- start:7120 stop:7464 length:345 start_codon:yes stop_codon:yes gene_type:complete